MDRSDLAVSASGLSRPWTGFCEGEFSPGPGHWPNPAPDREGAGIASRTVSPGPCSERRVSTMSPDVLSTMSPAAHFAATRSDIPATLRCRPTLQVRLRSALKERSQALSEVGSLLNLGSRKHPESCSDLALPRQIVPPETVARSVGRQVVVDIARPTAAVREDMIRSPFVPHDCVATDMALSLSLGEDGSAGGSGEAPSQATSYFSLLFLAALMQSD